MNPERERELQKQVVDGEKAKRLQGEIAPYFQQLRETCYTNISSSHHSKKKEREYLYLQLKAIDGVEKQLTGAINGGRKAESRLKDLIKTITGGQNNGSQP